MKSAIIVANGSSSRFGKNKLSEQLFGTSVLETTVKTFVPLVDEVIVVTDDDRWQKIFPFAKVVCGGETRCQSVQCGLDALHADCTLVAIHDGARPFVSAELIERLFDQAEKRGSAVPMLPVTDTLYRQGVALDRNEFFTVQTPQVFNCEQIKRAYAEKSNDGYSDDSQVYRECFGAVNFVDGDNSNRKITYPSDICRFKCGVGYDVHKLTEGNGLVLGGVVVPFDKKAEGHSDADVLVHAIMDALLSAVGLKDIGTQFPDTDERYEGISSMILLAKVTEMVRERNFRVVNVSAEIALQKPRLAPYLDQMRVSLATALQIDVDNVALSATTTEGLGVIGEGNGIACFATSSVVNLNF